MYEKLAKKTSAKLRESWRQFAAELGAQYELVEHNLWDPSEDYTDEELAIVNGEEFVKKRDWLRAEYGSQLKPSKRAELRMPHPCGTIILREEEDIWPTDVYLRKVTAIADISAVQQFEWHLTHKIPFVPANKSAQHRINKTPFPFNKLPVPWGQMLERMHEVKVKRDDVIPLESIPLPGKLAKTFQCSGSTNVKSLWEPTELQRLLSLSTKQLSLNGIGNPNRPHPSSSRITSSTFISALGASDTQWLFAVMSTTLNQMYGLSLIEHAEG